MPSISSNQEECIKCPEGCLKCSGNINNIICSECSKDYMLYEGLCIQNCNKGYEEKCKECNKNTGTNNRCSKCNKGYYLPDLSTDLNYNYLCKQCPANCISCYGDYNNPICTECNSKHVLKNGECKEGCYFLNMRNCLTYDDSGEFPICSLCTEGFYFPSNHDKFYDRCFKCSIPGCNKCEGENEYSDKCIECESIYTPIINDGIIQSCIKMCDIGTSDKCKSCSNEIGKWGNCNDGFELNGGMCYIKDFDIEAEYVTLRENELVKLMNCVSEFLEVDGIKYNGYSSNYFYMEKPGVHKVKMKLSPYCSFPSLFYDNPFLKSIKFYDHFDSKRITLMNDCFCNCPNLEFVDLSNLDLSNNQCFMNFFKNDKKLKEVHFPKSEVYPHYIYGMIQNCESLTSIDISSIHNDYVSYNMHNMFQGCSNLMNINIKSFHFNWIWIRHAQRFTREWKNFYR